MTEQSDRYGAPFDDPDVVAAVELLAGLSYAERARVLQAVASAVYGYHRTHDTGGLVAFARDFAATARLRSSADYEKAAAATPTRATGPGWSVREVFEHARR